MVQLVEYIDLGNIVDITKKYGMIELLNYDWLTVSHVELDKRSILLACVSGFVKSIIISSVNDDTAVFSN